MHHHSGYAYLIIVCYGPCAQFDVPSVSISATKGADLLRSPAGVFHLRVAPGLNGFAVRGETNVLTPLAHVPSVKCIASIAEASWAWGPLGALPPGEWRRSPIPMSLSTLTSHNTFATATRYVVRSTTLRRRCYATAHLRLRLHRTLHPESRSSEDGRRGGACQGARAGA